MEERMTSVVNILSEFFIPNGENKSWFWKFRHLLYEIEFILIKQNTLANHFELQKILQYYHLF